MAELRAAKPLGEHFPNLTPIGEGSFGQVSKAKDMRYKDRTVALKQLKVGAKCHKDYTMERLSREVRTLYKCRGCDLIVHLFDAWLDDSSLWMSMEYCCGGSLRDIMNTYRPMLALKEFEIKVVCSRMLRALNFLHGLDIIHRDIKAENLVVNGKGEVKMADFGLSYIKGGSKINPKSLVFTLAWVAPEVLKAGGKRRYTSKADIWSVGITAIEMAMGQEPKIPGLDELAEYDDMVLCARKERVCNPSPELPQEGPRGLKFSHAFRQFVSDCLNKDVSKRPSAAELLNDAWIHSVTKEESRKAKTELAGLAKLMSQELEMKAPVIAAKMYNNSVRTQNRLAHLVNKTSTTS